MEKCVECCGEWDVGRYSRVGVFGICDIENKRWVYWMTSPIWVHLIWSDFRIFAFSRFLLAKRIFVSIGWWW